MAGIPVDSPRTNLISAIYDISTSFESAYQRSVFIIPEIGPQKAYATTKAEKHIYIKPNCDPSAGSWNKIAKR